MGDAAMAVICGLDFWILGSPHTPDPSLLNCVGDCGGLRRSGGVQPAERYTASPTATRWAFYVALDVRWILLIDFDRVTMDVRLNFNKISIEFQ